MTFDTRSQPVRHSHLKLIAQSPAHAYHAMRTGYGEPTLSTRLGSGTHGMIFEPHKVIVYEGRRAGKAWESFESEHAEQVILNPREHALARGIADALLRHGEAKRLLLDGTTVEQTVEWSIDGRLCRGTPDAYTRSRVVDLKTTKPKRPDWFCRDAMRMGYVSQVDWYRDGLYRCGLVERGAECFLVVVENAPPHVVTCLRVTERVLELGQRSRRLWWEQWRACELANHWPGYVDATIDFTLPDDDELFIPDDGDDDVGDVSEAW